MSQDELQELSLEQLSAKKKKFNLDKFLQQFNTLDMNNYGSWPISVKITC
ncbi:type 4a pilus biogenesis protein PilO, partial [Acinetobacter baumannii]